MMMYDAPIVKYKKDDNKPKPGEKGYTRTAEQARKAYEKWKKRKEEEEARGVKYDLETFIRSGEKKQK